MSVEKKETPKNGSPEPEVTPNKKVKTPKISADKMKIEELTIKVAELQDKRLRLKAEFDNFRKRRDKEMLRMMEYEGEEIIKDILPIVDDLERVVDAVNSETDKDDHLIEEGVAMIISKINKNFKSWKIKPIGKVGEILNIDLHDAMMVRTEKGKKDNEILEVFQKGYKYKELVLRHARVIVNKK